METIRKIFLVERREINYLRIVIESYDGMAVVSTVDPVEALIEIQVSSGCEGLVDQLLDHFRENEHMKIIAQTGLV